MKSVLFAALLILPALSFAGSNNFKAECVGGVVVAKSASADGPQKVLTLRLAGITTVPCTTEDAISVETAGEVSNTPNEGLKFSAVTTIVRKGSPDKLMILSTYQEKAFARSGPAQPGT